MDSRCLTCDLLNSKKSHFSSVTSPTRVIVDEDEPEVDVDDTPFVPRDVSGDVNSVRRRRFDEAFDVFDFLGRGRFGEVKRCREKSTGAEFAAKFIRTPNAKDRQDAGHEVNIMRKLRSCRRLVQLYDVFETKNEVCLVLECIHGGELFERAVSDDFMLTEKACVCFVRQICQGIAFMHSRNIIHLDMKPENILCLSRSGNRIKIIDFGLAREYHSGDETRVMYGTPEFMAPEVVQFDPVNYATDMWSLGVICYVLLSGLSPFMGDNDPETMTNVANGHYDFHSPEFDNISEAAKDMISNLLQADKKRRLSAEDCLHHRWLQKTTEVVQISKDRLRQYVYRRKWQKAVNAMIALKRMGLDLRQLDSSKARGKSAPPSLLTEQHPPVRPRRKPQNITVGNGVIDGHQGLPIGSSGTAVADKPQRPLVVNVGVDGRSVVDDNSNFCSAVDLNKNDVAGRTQLHSDIKHRHQHVMDQTVAPPSEYNGYDNGTNTNSIHTIDNNNDGEPTKQRRHSPASASVKAIVSVPSRLHQSLLTSDYIANCHRQQPDCDFKETDECPCERRTKEPSIKARIAEQSVTIDNARSAAENSVGSGNTGSVWAGSGARSKTSSSSFSFGRRLNAIVRDRIIFFNQKDKSSGSTSSKTIGNDVVKGRDASKKSAPTQSKR